ncbi:MAG TPA: hypothetical protein VLZ83_03950 [Edaphocola sp.]|nr:hypothetical protein [Edaphocola sp.]
MKKSLFAFCLFIFSYSAFSQNAIQNMITADSLKSGNYKDVFTSFFQLAFQNLSGDEKSFNFQSNPFAVMLKGNENLEVDTNWYKYRHLRNLNFIVGLNADSNFKIQGFNFGVNYALVNKRDLTVSKLFFQQANQLKGQQLANKFAESFAKIRRTIPISQESDFRNRFKNESEAFLNADDNNTFNSFSDDVRAYILSHISALEMPELFTLINQYGDVSLNDLCYQDIELLKQEFLMKPLWVIGVQGASRGSDFSIQSLEFNTNFLTGIGNLSQPRFLTYELEANAHLSIKRDSLNINSTHLDRSVFDLSALVNASFRPDRKQSIAELKLGLSYKNVFSGLYVWEQKQEFNIDSELRFRVFNDIWVPLLLSYNLEQNRFFVGMNLSYNFISLFKNKY